MILDAALLLDSGAALTTTRSSWNTIDLGGVVDVGVSEEALEILFRFTELPTADGAATLVVAVQTSPDNSTWTTLVQSGAMPLTAFAERSPSGTFRMKVPAGVSRYIRLVYTIANGPLTAGRVHASLVKNRDFHNYYPKNYVAI
ncbi:Bbp16 family capsid cement protein [Siccirubricoccus phaeus]|uniref:Bbp16 family capsid cement protein n=1 Tax=Siccirubricoccus phaeus TaxID=2595053 RepID=UPI0011F3B7B0|nr:hypothetical protein [Siccirubricoccus phaeus]